MRNDEQQKRARRKSGTRACEKRTGRRGNADDGCDERAERPGSRATRERTTPPLAAGRARTPRKPARRLPPEVLQDDEVRALMHACGGTPTGIRNRALIALLYRAGLRIGEALALHPRDINLGTGEIRVLHGKGDRFRIVGIDPGATPMIEAWLAVRARMRTSRALPLPSSAALFCTREGGPIADAYIRRLMKRLAAKAGLDRRVHAHGLRHTHAAQLRAEGIDIGIVSKQLGHRSILTTIRYLDHIAPVQVVKAMRGREWGELNTRAMPTPLDGTCYLPDGTCSSAHRSPPQRQ